MEDSAKTMSAKKAEDTKLSMKIVSEYAGEMLQLTDSGHAWCEVASTFDLQECISMLAHEAEANAERCLGTRIVATNIVTAKRIINTEIKTKDVELIDITMLGR